MKLKMNVEDVAVSMAKPTEIETRVKRVLDVSRSRKPLSRRLVATVILSVATGVPLLATATRQEVTVAAQPVPQITSVDNVGHKVIINAQTDGTKQMALLIGKDRWQSGKQGVIVASFEPSNEMRLENGATGHGFSFKVGGAGSSGTFYINIPYGQIVLRKNAQVSQQGGVFTIADIKQADGKLIPVTVQLADKT